MHTLIVGYPTNRAHQPVTASDQPAASHDLEPDRHDDIMYPSAIPFVLVHLACFAAIWTGVTWRGGRHRRRRSTGCACSRSARAITATSRTAPIPTGRVFQFILAFLAQSTAQKSVLWWAAKHRHHHLHLRYASRTFIRPATRASSTPMSAGSSATPARRDRSRARSPTSPSIPELMWLHRFELVPAVVLAVLTCSDRGLAGPGRRLLLEHGRASITARSASIRWPTCTAASAT